MRTVNILLFGLGLLLLLLNVFGLFKSMRHNDLYTEENTGRLNDVTIRLDDAKDQLVRQEGELDKDFALRVNDVVSKSMSHYFKNEGKKKYNLRVPARENYILFLVNSLKEDDRYEFKNYKKGLERGVGLCSSHSIVVKGVLLDNGIEAHLWDIAGHVVVRARVSENEWYILDPDYGLYVPYDIDEIEADPEITRPSYEHMASLYKPDYDDPYTTDKVVELFGKEGNHIYTYDARFENFSYVAIWVLPLLLMVPLVIFRIRQRS